MPVRILLFLLMVIPAAPADAGQKILLGTLEWPPYVSQSIKDNGYVAVLVKEAFRRGGVAAEFQFSPWNRAVALVKVGKLHGYFPEYYAEAVTRYAAFSDPFPGGPLGFFKRKTDQIRYDDLTDLKGLRIGTVLGYVNTKAFDEADFLLKEPVTDDLTNFRKLLAGRIDLVVADKYVGTALVNTHMPAQRGRIEFLAKPLEVKSLYVCISNQIPTGSQLLSAFNKGLAQMKEDGTMTALLKEYE